MFPTDSIHKLIMPTLIVAQISALFPVSGITIKTSRNLRFSWNNYRLIYCLTVWVAMFVVLYVTWQSEQADDTPLSILNARLLDVIAPPVLFFPIFLHISYKWRKFVHKWELTEEKLPAFRRIQNLNLRLRVMLMIFVSARIGFITVTLVTFLAMISSCLRLESFWDQLGTYFLIYYQKVFRITSPAPWKYAGLFVIEVITTLQWVSCSLLITVLSVILTARFRAFNNHLEAFKMQLMPPKYWQEMRDAYTNLSQLTVLLDDLLSPLVLVTFIMETLNIIIYIYWAISNVKDVITYTLAAFRCLKVVMVTLITQFAVSAVYEESRRPLEVFNLVPSVSYSREVKRLYEQVSTDTLALSGCQFFYVTRSVILTMVSTIVTYEVVLIQFGSYEPFIRHTNSSVPLYCEEWILPNHTKQL